MASSSNVNNSSPGEKYPYPTEFNVLDFVPKLSSEANYDKWKSLMWDYVDSQHLVGFIDDNVTEEEREFIRRQDLVGFIDDNLTEEEREFIRCFDATVAENDSKQHDYIAWKRSNNLVRRWILATLNEDTCIRVLRFKSANFMWRELKRIFDASGSVWQLDEEMENRQGRYLALHIAAINGDWDQAKGIIEHDPDAVRTPITPISHTALHLAVASASAGRDFFVRKLLEKMTPQDIVDLVDVNGETALHYAANVDNAIGAKMLVNKNLDLPNVSANHGVTPLHWAAQYGSREMVVYLKEVTADDRVDASLLFSLIWSELYDIAFTLLRKKPELANAKPNPFVAIAKKRSSFPSGNSFNFWQRLIYSGVPMRLEGNNIANLRNEGGGGTGDMENQVVSNFCKSVRQRLQFMIWGVAEKLVPCVKRIREKKERQHHALKLVKFLSLEVLAKSKLSIVQIIFKKALRKAARAGIPEIIEEIIAAYPLALSFMDLNGLNIFKYAIVYRRERVFNLIYQINAGWRAMGILDSSSNNGLHLAAHLSREQQINLKANAAGAILQMQREVQWFKEVEKYTLPLFREERNIDGMTPAELFSDTHQDLVKEGERWMKDTATSCTIVAALIATMAFAAAVTAPGGNDSNNGHPLLSKQKAFVIFGISDALALFSSITSVLMFLLILTSRYAEEDFLYTLPNRLIIGLITLFFSILSTMVAFGAILYLVFGDNKAWILIPIIAMASIPVNLFGALQFPLLKEMIQSTYGRGIFGKQSNRVLG